MNTKHKPRLNIHRKTHSAQPGCMNCSWKLCTWKASSVWPKCQGPQLLFPLFLMTSNTKHAAKQKGGLTIV